MEVPEITKPLKSTVVEKTDNLEGIYKETFPAVAGFVKRMNGTAEDAKDIFHDALVIYLEKEASTGFITKTSPKAYILGIAKHLWIRKYQVHRHLVDLNGLERSISVGEEKPPVLYRRLLRMLEVSGKKCMDLLRAFYYQEKDAANIASELGYGNAHSASVQKYKCLEKIRSTVKQKSLEYEHFTA